MRSLQASAIVTNFRSVGAYCCLSGWAAYAIFSMLCVCYTQFLKSECNPCQMPGNFESMQWNGGIHKLDQFILPY